MQLTALRATDYVCLRFKWPHLDLLWGQDVPVIVKGARLDLLQVNVNLRAAAWSQAA
jgi:hypothetical protein